MLSCDDYCKSSMLVFILLAFSERMFSCSSLPTQQSNLQNDHRIQFSAFFYTVRTFLHRFYTALLLVYTVSLWAVNTADHAPQHVNSTTCGCVVIKLDFFPHNWPISGLTVWAVLRLIIWPVPVCCTPGTTHKMLKGSSMIIFQSNSLSSFGLGFLIVTSSSCHVSLFFNSLFHSFYTIYTIPWQLSLRWVFYALVLFHIKSPWLLAEILLVKLIEKGSGFSVDICSSLQLF